MVLGIIANTDLTRRGISYGISRPLYCANHGPDAVWETMEWAVLQGANVINSSLGLGYAPNDARITEEFYADYITYISARTVTIAAGNYGGKTGEERGWVVHPSYTYNGIVVGASDDNDTGGWGDDTILASSSWKELPIINPMTDLAKPDLVATGNRISATTGGASSTSIVAPMVAGGAVLLTHKRSFLKWWPELVKALMLAGVLQDLPDNVDLTPECTSHDHYPHRDECDGAGAPEFGTMSKVLDSGYWQGGFRGPDGPWPLTFTFPVTVVNDWVSVAFVWDAVPSADGRSPSTLIADQQYFSPN